MKKNILTFSLAMVAAFQSSAQDAKENKDLSFLKGQKNIKLEFSYEGLRIDDQPEAAFLKQKTEECNNKKAGSGDEDLESWTRQKEFAGPKFFIDAFQKEFKPGQMECVTDIIDKEGNTESSKQKPKSKIKPQYVCVVTLIEIKIGKGRMVTPTLWVKYTFYENEKRTNVLAEFKDHLAYGRDDGGYTRFGGFWAYLAEPYMVAGKHVGQQIKKYIK